MAQKYKVTTQSTGLNLRSSADTTTDKNILISIPKGAIVEDAGGSVVVPVQGWKYVSYNTYYGYASAQYLTPVDDNGTPTGEPDKSNPVKDDSNSSGNVDKKEPNGKAWMIAGGIALGIGAVLNLVL